MIKNKEDLLSPNAVIPVSKEKTNNSLEKSLLRVLFVDSQPENENDLQTLIDELGPEWECHICRNCDDAFQVLEKAQFDVVISEMLMNDMDSAQFHKKLSELYPGTVRIIYSENTDKGIYFKAAKFIHQFIAKPCAVDIIKKIIRNSIGLSNLLGDEKLRARIRSIDDLPSFPEIYIQLEKELQKDDISIRRVADLIRQDVYITAKLLKITNSAFFGLTTYVNNPLQAVNLLGLHTVQSIVMAASVFEQFKYPNLPGYSLDIIFNESIAVGAGAQALANSFGLSKQMTDDSLLAGMLHDVGKLIMLTYFQKEFVRAVKMSENDGIPLEEAEREIIGISHAEAGAYLLSLWGLPGSVVEATAFHSNPNLTPSPVMNVLTTVHLAYAFNQEKAIQEKETDSSALDMEYLEKLDLSKKVKFLKPLCQDADL
jgi:HD-like signal output (HDOD) protein